MVTPARPIAAQAAVPPARYPWLTTACVVALTVAATLWAVLGQDPGAARIAGTRAIALLLAALYGAAHAVIRWRAGSSARVGGFGSLRISCLDLALYWLLVFLLAPFFL
jgi:hypothetical protein